MKNRFFLTGVFAFFVFIALFLLIVLEVHILGYAVLDSEGTVYFEEEANNFYEGSSPISGINNLEIGSLQKFNLDQGDSKEIKLNIRNGGVNFLNNCKIQTNEYYNSWFSSLENTGLAAGEKRSFLFKISVPEEAESGEHNIHLVISCDEVTKSVFLDLDIIKKSFEVNILDIESLESGEINVSYYLKDLSGEDSFIDIELILKTLCGEELFRFKENIALPKDSLIERYKVIDLKEISSGEVRLFLNANAEKCSSFVIESFFVNSGTSISGFSIADNRIPTDKAFSLLMILIFLVFGFFVLRKIFFYRRKVIIEE